SGPIERVAPGLNRLADSLSSPVITELPLDLSQFVDTLKEVSRRLQPLTQMAETASSLFGLRGLSSLRSTVREQPAQAPASAAPPPRATAAPAKQAAAKKAATKKAATKKASTKKTATKSRTSTAKKKSTATSRTKR